MSLPMTVYGEEIGAGLTGVPPSQTTAAPGATQTQTNPGPGTTRTQTTAAPGTTQTLTGTPNPGMSISLNNPLGEDITIQQFFLKIIDIVLVFAIPLLVLYIMFAGFKYVMARGNSSEIESATTALTWAIVGGVLIIGAKVILTVIEGTVRSLQ